jgi:Integrase core domain
MLQPFLSLLDVSRSLAGQMRDERWVEGRPRHGTRDFDAEPRLHNVHSTVDDHSRLAYSEIIADGRAEACAAFLRRAMAFYAAHGIRVERLLTDNAKMYRCSHVFRATAAELAQTAVHPSAPAPDQRKDRALQPDAPGGVGLRPALSDQTATGSACSQLGSTGTTITGPTQR